MEQFKHYSPVENPDDPYSHKLEIIVDGESIGDAEVEYFSRPFPLYQISMMGINLKHQGKGFGSKLMGFIENFLIEKGKAGVLVDAIAEMNPDNSPAIGMYKRRGWIEVPNGLGLHVFNMPKDATLDQLKGYALRYTDYAVREERKNKI